MVAASTSETFGPMDEETLAPYVVAPWLGAEGQEAFSSARSPTTTRATQRKSSPSVRGHRERPVLMVWGEEERWIALQRGRGLQEAIAGWRLETIARSAGTSPRRTPLPWWSTARTSSARRAATRRLFTHLRGI